MMNVENEIIAMKKEIEFLKSEISKIKSCSCSMGIICYKHKNTNYIPTNNTSNNMEKRKQDILKYKPTARFTKVMDPKEMMQLPCMKEESEKKKIMYERELRKKEKETQKNPIPQIKKDIIPKKKLNFKNNIPTLPMEETKEETTSHFINDISIISEESDFTQTYAYNEFMNDLNSVSDDENAEDSNMILDFMRELNDDIPSSPIYQPEIENIPSSPIYQPEINDISAQPEINDISAQPEIDDIPSSPIYQPEIENISAQPEIENISAQPEIENISAQPEIENISSQPEIENISSQPEINDISAQYSQPEIESELKEDKCNITEEELNAKYKTIKDLKKFCKDNGYKGFSAYTHKTELIKFIISYSKNTVSNTDMNMTRGSLMELSLKQIKEICKNKGIKGHSKFTKKEEIINFILERI